MADLRTEEEQIELLKKWWQENGKSTVAGVVIALAGYSGWMGWQSHQQDGIQAAAEVYQQMLSAAESSDQAKVSALAEQLRQQHDATPYAVFAALQLAKEAVSAKDLARAAEMLDWARARNRDKAQAPLISVRLAQVQYAQGEHDNALATLAAVKTADTWLPAVAELRGDIELAQGKLDAARASYAAALKALEASGAQERRSDLEMKLADLAVPSVPVADSAGSDHS